MLTEHVTPVIELPPLSEASFTTQLKSDTASAGAPEQCWNVTVNSRPGGIGGLVVSTPSISP